MCIQQAICRSIDQVHPHADDVKGDQQTDQRIESMLASEHHQTDADRHRHRRQHVGKQVLCVCFEDKGRIPSGEVADS